MSAGEAMGHRRVGDVYCGDGPIGQKAAIAAAARKLGRPIRVERVLFNVASGGWDIIAYDEQAWVDACLRGS